MAVIGRDPFQASIEAASRTGESLRARLARARSPRRRGRGGDDPRARRFVEFGLAILIGLAAARLVWAALAPLSAPETPPPAFMAASDGPAALRHPFRLIDAPPPPVEAQATETTLKLMLHGAWTEIDGRESAIIRTPDGRQATFSVGDEICCGASLERVYADRVTIIRDGVRESLSLPNRQAVAPAPTPRADDSPTGPADGAEAFRRIVRIQPVRDASGLLRLALFPSTDEAAFLAAGLQEGDILISFAGKPAPTDLPGMAQLLPGLHAANMLDVTIERDGVRLPLEIDLTGSGAKIDEEE